MEKEKIILKEEIELKQKILNFFNKNDVFLLHKKWKTCYYEFRNRKAIFFLDKNEWLFIQNWKGRIVLWLDVFKKLRSSALGLWVQVSLRI